MKTITLTDEQAHDLYALACVPVHELFYALKDSSAPLVGGESKTHDVNRLIFKLRRELQPAETKRPEIPPLTTGIFAPYSHDSKSRCSRCRRTTGLHFFSDADQIEKCSACGAPW